MGGFRFGRLRYGHVVSVLEFFGVVFQNLNRYGRDGSLANNNDNNNISGPVSLSSSKATQFSNLIRLIVS